MCYFFAISCERSEWWSWFFLHADNCNSFLQIDTLNLMGIVKHSQSPENSKFAMFLQNLKKDVRDEVDFLLVDNCQSFIQVDLGT